MKDWIDIIEEFETIANNNPFVKKFGYGRKENKQALFDSFDKQFPVLYINSDSFNYNKGAFVYNVTLDVFSILKDSLEDADKWKWYSFVIGLTNDDPLKLEEAFNYTFFDSCVYYLYKLENKQK